ncbi:hypothetical protein RhiirC2_803070, partial [Rhizophagus irregularis]
MAIAFKRLTDKQLAYLHNSVLLPRLEFRAQTTYIPPVVCRRIQLGFQRIFRKHTHLPRSFPLIAIHGLAFYDINDLFQQLSTNRFSRLQRMMIAESVQLITRIRIFKLRNALACGVSPFDIIDFSPWMKLRRFSQDWFF